MPPWTTAQQQRQPCICEQCRLDKGPTCSRSIQRGRDHSQVMRSQHARHLKRAAVAGAGWGKAAAEVRVHATFPAACRGQQADPQQPPAGRQPRDQTHNSCSSSSQTLACA